MGAWAIKDRNGWAEMPVDVFYVENPDRSKGHNNYFGMYTVNGVNYITNAESAFEDSFLGIAEGNYVYVSRFRHDYVSTPNGCAIDGGRDYLKTSGEVSSSRDLVEVAEKKLSNTSRFVRISVKDGEFEFSELLNNDEQNKKSADNSDNK